MNSLLVHYNEIALKGGNRPRFVRSLARNLLRVADGLGVDRVEPLQGRIVLRLAPGARVGEILERVARVFGVANLSPAESVPPDLESLRGAVGRAAQAGGSFSSFRISARRAAKSFPLSSIELNRALGAHVQSLHPARVDLEHAEREFHVEVLPEEALVYSEKLQGPGGLPGGVSGRVAALLSGGIDSPVAAYRMMKRGCQVVFIHFHGWPLVEGTSRRKSIEIVDRLTRWQGQSRLWLVAFGELQREVLTAVPAELRVVVYRRLMGRIAEALARREGAAALVTGEALGQVASQTLPNLVTIEDAVEMMVLRPLVGMDKEEITREARALGTFEVSVEPDEDCCRLFVPSHPATRTSPEQLRRAEGALPVPSMVAQAAAQAELRTFSFP